MARLQRSVRRLMLADYDPGARSTSAPVPASHARCKLCLEWRAAARACIRLTRPICYVFYLDMFFVNIYIYKVCIRDMFIPYISSYNTFIEFLIFYCVCHDIPGACMHGMWQASCWRA